MKLSLSGVKEIANPTLDQIENAICVLHSLFVILSRREDEFMQVRPTGCGWLLEFQDGSVDEHYQCTNKELPLKEVTAALHAYRAGDDSWRESLEWKRIKV